MHMGWHIDSHTSKWKQYWTVFPWKCHIKPLRVKVDSAYWSSCSKCSHSFYNHVCCTLQPIHLFFLPAAYIKCSLVCRVCQGCVRVALWELQLWGAVSWCCLLHIILLFPLCLLLSTSISVSQINFSPEMIKKTLMIFRICSLVYPWDKADFCCL